MARATANDPSVDDTDPVVDVGRPVLFMRCSGVLSMGALPGLFVLLGIVEAVAMSAAWTMVWSISRTLITLATLRKPGFGVMFGRLLARKKTDPRSSLGEIIYSTSDYRISFRLGRGQRVVLAFCGAQLSLGGLQTEEFRTSLGENCSTYFIADLKRSWWNDGRIEDAIQAAIRHALDRRPDATFGAIGNSMGGSGALVAAHIEHRIDRCLAIAPQADVRLSAEDDRWMNYRIRIQEHRWPNFALPAGNAGIKIIFGADEDEWQRQVFISAGFPVETYEGYGHSVGRKLRDDHNDIYSRLIEFVLGK